MAVPLALVLAGVATVVTLLLVPASGQPAVPVPRAFAFRLPEVRPGRAPAVLEATPGQPVVLNFFAAWCDPCHAELPLMAGLQRTEAGRLGVIGVDVQDNRDLGAQLLAEAGAGFAAGYDPDRAVSSRWAVYGLPVTVFIAPDGTVVDYHRGQLRAADLNRRVARLLRVSATAEGTGASLAHRQS